MAQNDYERQRGSGRPNSARSAQSHTSTRTSRRSDTTETTRRARRSGRTESTRDNAAGSARTRTSSRAQARQANQTNYTLNRSKKRGVSRLARLEFREIALIAAALLILIFLIVGIASCARSCASEAPENQVDEVSLQQQQNPQDARVAFGASSRITSLLTPALDEAEAIQSIAEHANELPEGLVELALREKEAIDFVRDYASASRSGESYNDQVTQGTVPLLYCFDKRWGAVDYNGQPLALTGSGPACLSMAYMGFTGRSDATPAVLATVAARNKQAKGESGTDPDFFIGECGNMNIGCMQEEVAEGILMDALYQRNVVLAQIKADTLTPESHWVLVCGYNENGAVIVYDPTSSEVSGHEWDAATISTAANMFLTLSPANEGYGEGYSYYIGEDEPQEPSSTSASSEVTGVSTQSSAVESSDAQSQQNTNSEESSVAEG